MAWGSLRSPVRVLAAGGVIVLAACNSPQGGQSASSSSTAPATTAAAPTTAPPVTYQVKRGDTLTSIARFFGVSSQALAAANQLENQDRLTEGQLLQIPPAPPAGLEVTPPDGISGQVFTFTVRGARVGETIVFQIVGPEGQSFSGSPHTAGDDGVVSATYVSSGDGRGKYTVVATGDRGTSLSAGYHLLG
jgi:LysM repeat protein